MRPIGIALVVAVVVAHAHTAFADPVKRVDLGDGLTLSIEGGKLVVRKGKQWAPLGLGLEIDDVKLDRKHRTVDFTLDDGQCPGFRGQSWKLDALAARAENASAYLLHVKKDFKAAADGYARAIALDGSWDIPAYNLAGALTSLHDLDGATKALASRMKDAPYATYAQVATDPELAPLLARPEVRVVLASKPGTAQLASGLARQPEVLYSAERGLVAVDFSEGTAEQCGYHESYVLHELATDRVVAILPVVLDGDFAAQVCGDPSAVALSAAGKAAVGKRSANVQAILVALGFSPTTIEKSPDGTIDGNSGDADTKWKVYFEKSKIGVVVKSRVGYFRSGAIHVLRGNTSLGTGTGAYAKLAASLFLVDLDAVVVNTYEPGMSTCGIDPHRAANVIKLK